MTDTGFTDPTPTPAPAAAPAPEQDYKALYEQEKNERIKERNIYRPATRLLGDLDEDARQAFLSLAEMYRNGDNDAMVEFMLSSVQNISGKDAAALIAERQNKQSAAPLGAQPQPQQTPAQPQFDPNQVQTLVQKQVQEALQVQRQIEMVTNELTGAGYPPQSAAGQTIIYYAQQNGVPIADAISWFKADLAQQVLGQAQQAATVAGQIPQPSPTGAPAGSAPAADMTPKERAMARLRGANQV